MDLASLKKKKPVVIVILFLSAQVTEKGNPVIDLTSEPTTEQTDLQRAIALSLKDNQQATPSLG